MIMVIISSNGGDGNTNVPTKLNVAQVFYCRPQAACKKSRDGSLVDSRGLWLAESCEDADEAAWLNQVESPAASG